MATITTSPITVPIVTTASRPVNITVPVGKKGDKGDKGDPGQDAQWARMTQADYDALPEKDPLTLYVIIG